MLCRLFSSHACNCQICYHSRAHVILVRRRERERNPSIRTSVTVPGTHADYVGLVYCMKHQYHFSIKRLAGTLRKFWLWLAYHVSRVLFAEMLLPGP
jgi:hypothetical protein